MVFSFSKINSTAKKLGSQNLFKFVRFYLFTNLNDKLKNQGKFFEFPCGSVHGNRTHKRSLLFSSPSPSKMPPSRCEGDPNSFSNPLECLVTHKDLHLTIDFDRQILKGFVDLTVERKQTKANLKLDTRDLNILSIRNKNTSNKIPFDLGPPSEAFGTKLEVHLPKRGKSWSVRIEYETSPKARALQWLKPCQTAGKKHPYVFSQCQAINARTLVPCQDTPSVKFTYYAEITVPKELVALMSAIEAGWEKDSSSKTFKFEQKVPIPSYLLAIVAGSLESREIGPRSHVWSEKEFLDEAAQEFDDTDKFIKIAEDLLGEYEWGKYDLLVLPPSFAFGGMENPCLTFVTPTLLAGDKSLIDVIYHEISHSWTGNLVTNRNFEHFWLNEGFTMFVERKILGRIRGESYRHFDALGGWKDLEYAIETEKPEATALIPDLKDHDPDDYFNSVPYEKGFTLLFYLEELLGGPEVFEKFLKSYIQEFRRQSIDTDVWKSYLYKYFSDKEDILNKVDWDAWFFAPGLPPVKPKYDDSLLQKCNGLCRAWSEANDLDLSSFKAEDILELSSQQIIQFLELLTEEKSLSLKKIEKMAELYKFNEVKNAEIRFKWLHLSLLSKWNDIVPEALKFVNEQGRLKYVLPIYRDLHNWTEVRDQAIENFKAHESSYMYVTAHDIRKILQLSEEK